MRALFLYHDQHKKFVPIADGFTIGRSEGSLRFDHDPLISRVHCRFHLVGSDVYVEDLDSTNRTQVNRVPIMPKRRRRLLLNDVIKVGDQRLILTQQQVHEPAGSQDATMYRKIEATLSRDLEKPAREAGSTTLLLANSDLSSELPSADSRRQQMLKKKLARRGAVSQKRSMRRWSIGIAVASVAWVAFQLLNA
jgi:pSer/pThr/pTyr-binding forkhead associated (FHA) protein